MQQIESIVIGTMAQVFTIYVFRIIANTRNMNLIERCSSSILIKLYGYAKISDKDQITAIRKIVMKIANSNHISVLSQNIASLCPIAR